MNSKTNTTALALLFVLTAPAANAYNYLTCDNGSIRNFNNGHMTFNYGNNLTSTEKATISIAMSRLTAFSNSSFSIGNSNDTDYATENEENEIYMDSSVGAAVCSSWANPVTCDVLEADIRFGTAPNWVTATNSQHAPYVPLATARSILGTAVHEGGHCIGGVDHSNDLYNMMGDDWDHVTRQGTGAYYGPGEDLSDAMIDLLGKKSGNNSNRDLGVTIFRYLGADGEYSEHRFGQLLDSGGSPLPVVGSFVGQDVFQVVAGETVQMELTFENNGELNTESPDVGFYLSTNSIISASDVLLGTDTGYTLGRNSPYENEESVTIPISTTPGNYFLGALIDHQNTINEVTNANNVAYYPVSVIAPPPDMTVPFAGVDDTTVAPGDTIKSLAITRNSGTGPADATTLRYYRSNDSTISTFDTLIALDSISALAPNQQQATNADTNAPAPGTYWYGACVDDVPGEVNLGNQCSSGTQVSVAYEPPEVTTNPASNITFSSATLNANFDPNSSLPTLVGFQWGETTQYGNMAWYTGPIAAGNISVDIEGLICMTNYHFRAIVLNEAGLAAGADQQFVTLTCSGCEG